MTACLRVRGPQRNPRTQVHKAKLGHPANSSLQRPPRSAEETEGERDVPEKCGADTGKRRADPPFADDAKGRAPEDMEEGGGHRLNSLRKKSKSNSSGAEAQLIAKHLCRSPSKLGVN